MSGTRTSRQRAAAEPTSESTPSYVGDTNSTAATRDAPEPQRANAASMVAGETPRHSPEAASYSGVSQQGSAPDRTIAW